MSNNEIDPAASPKPVSMPAGMTRIRFFKILTNRPAQFDAILEAYNQARQMPVVQIPRAAVTLGEKVQTTEMEIPSSQITTNRRLDVSVDEFGNPLKSLIDSTGVVIISKLPPSQQTPESVASYQAQSLPTSSNNLSNNPFMQKMAEYK